MFFRFKDRTSLCLISFFQAFSLALYCSLVAIMFWKGNNLFGNDSNYWGPVLFLIIFATSALISALLVLGYPLYLIWQKKQIGKALRLIGYTTCWLIGFVLLGILLAIIF
jgi:hypothetical protein